MSKLSTTRLFFILAITAGAFLSASFMIMPFGSYLSLNEGKDGLLLFAGGLFWASLLAALVMWILAIISRRRYFERQGSAPPRDGRPGIISFFSNPAAVAADIGAAISIIGFVVTMILTQKNIITSNYAAFVFLFLTVLGLQLHAAFNGRVIRTITNNDLGGQNSDEN